MVKPKYSIKIEGTQEVARMLGADIQKIAKATENAMKESSLYMEAQVKASIAGRAAETKSVDTGLFLRSTASTFTPTSATVYNTVDYAPYLEYGTSKMKPRRHFGNVLAREQKKVVSFVREEVKKAL